MAFSEVETDSKMRMPQSHNDTVHVTFRTEEFLQFSEEKEDNTPVAYQDVMLPLETTQCEDEVDCAMLEAANTTITTKNDNDVLNRAQNITCTSTSAVISKRFSASDLDNELSNSFVHSEMRAQESAITSARSVRPSNTSVNSLHLDMLSCDGNYESTDASSPASEDEDEPKSKPPVAAETPLDIDGPLPSKFHNIPQFTEVHELLGRIPTFAEYMAYRLDKISMDLEWRYPELDKHIQQIISTLGNNLTYELFHQAAMNIHSQAKQMYEGVFMVLRFGRQLFQSFPERASNFTTQWVNEYIIHQGGWVSF